MPRRPKLLRITCPSPVTVASGTGDPVAVTYSGVQIAGGRAPYSVTYDPPSGSLFSVGITTVTVTVVSSDGQRMNCSFPVTVVNGTGRSLLTIDDLVWQGQAKFPSTGTANTDAGNSTGGWSIGLAVRYAYNKEVTPAIERLYLVCFYSTTSNTTVGDLVEYRAPALTTGAITGANEMIEVRRWKSVDWFPKTTDTQWGGQSGWLGGLYWQPDLTDANGGVLWCSTWGDYNAEGDFKNLYAVKLSNTMADATYSTVVQRYGPWEYTGLNNAEWKEVDFGMIPIPASAQPDLGGKTVALQGHYTSRSSLDYLQHGPSLRGLSALPTLATSAPWNSGDTIARGSKIMAHALNDGGTAKLQRTSMTDYAQIERYEYRVDDGGVWRDWFNNAPLTLGADTGDLFYIQMTEGAPTRLVNFYIAMSTPCTGGTKVWEYYNGTTWSALSGNWSIGNADLTASVNNFVLTSVPGDWAAYNANGYNAYWARARNTAGASVAGVVETTGSHATPAPADDLSGNSWYYQVDEHHGLVWVETPTKHGLVTFARQSDGGCWYGERHGFHGSTEIAVNNDFSSWAITTHGYRAQLVNPRLYIYDPMQIRAAAGNGNRNNIGPPSEGNWVTKWPNIPYHNSLDGGDFRYINIWNANVTFWDAVTNQIIWAPPQTSGTNPPAGSSTLQVFQV